MWGVNDQPQYQHYLSKKQEYHTKFYIQSFLSTDTFVRMRNAMIDKHSIFIINATHKKGMELLSNQLEHAKEKNVIMKKIARFWIVSFSLYHYQYTRIAYSSLRQWYILPSSSVQSGYDCPNINQDYAICTVHSIQLMNFKIALVQNLSISIWYLQMFSA